MTDIVHPNAGSFALYTPPPNVGCYKIGGPTTFLAFHFERKPCFVHRFMAKVLLGWLWEDFKQ